MIFSQLAQIILLTRVRLEEEIKKPYFRTAISKGLSKNRAVTHHALPNAVLPVITVIGSRFGFLITGEDFYPNVDYMVCISGSNTMGWW